MCEILGCHILLEQKGSHQFLLFQECQLVYLIHQNHSILDLKELKDYLNGKIISDHTVTKIYQVVPLREKCLCSELF